MNYQELKALLSEYDPNKVNVYLSYLKELETSKGRDKQPKNKWFPFFKPSQAAALYKKVAIDNLYIDGDTITLVNKGRVMINYNYHAYKNKLLNIYPETMFDVQNVYNNDSFSFKKDSGKVKYTHDFGNPFDPKRKIIGCYCVIKNNRGEFIETLDMEDIKKMRNVAMTQTIWNAWESEMILKSVIKRACKRHFKDIVVNIEVLDNENYDLEKADLDFNIQDVIEKCETLEDLSNVYQRYKGKVKNEPEFLTILGEKKKEILAYENS